MPTGQNLCLLNNTLLYVYRDLSDPELEEFSSFAESPEGKAYYQAALAAIRAEDKHGWLYRLDA